MITSEMEIQLRDAFARAGADIAVPPDATERLRASQYHPRQVSRGLVAGITALAAAVGIAVPLAFGAGSPAAALVSIRFDSYTFRLPAGFHATAASTRACQAMIVLIAPPPLKKGASGTGPILRPSYDKAMISAASAAGGCVGIALGPVYRQALRDPEVLPGARPVRVGKYDAMLWQHREPHELIRDLYVQLPLRHGKVRDLIVGSARLSTATLIRIVERGLSSRSDR
jgi:hypothetical protein